MIIKAVKLYKNGYMLQPFAMGGEDYAREGTASLAKYDMTVRYRSSLQNYVIDTGTEVILVDTGMPDGTPDAVPDAKTFIYMGTRIQDYIPALEAAGYTPDQVTKILLTHKHSDHSGMLDHFPHAQIIASPVEAASDELKNLPNVVPASFSDGPYYNFKNSQKIADGIYYIEAKGHTTGNSLVIVENDDLFYMIQGDITYTDEALYANKLSMVFEDLPAARETLNAVRAFISEHPTIYLSTHTPLGYENLEKNKVTDLNNPPESIPPKDIVIKTASGKYLCAICGFVYDPAIGDPYHGIPAGTPFEALPEGWHCPRCRQGKDNFTPA